MPKKTDPEHALQKLGERIRAGYAKEHPAQNLDTVRDAVREQYTQEQRTPRAATPAPDPSKRKQRQPPEPDRDLCKANTAGGGVDD